MDDVLKEDYECPKCGNKMFEKRPKDKYVVRNKELTVRLYCVCGYYRDDVVNQNDFKDI
jgi:C4-type Zn-finger protein